MKPRLFVATKAFIMHEGKVLILRESGSYEDGTNSGRYDVPGGRLNPGEHVFDALKREVKEETGLEVTVGRPVAVNEWRPVVRDEPWQIVGTFFLCEAATDQVILSEDHDDYLWIDPRAYKEYPVVENLHVTFQALNEVLESD